METVFYITAIFLLLLLTLYIFIIIRIRINPLYGKFPVVPHSSTFFGHIFDFVKNDCRILDVIKEHFVKYGTLRLSILFWGKTRLSIGEPKWIKLGSVLGKCVPVMLHADCLKIPPSTYNHLQYVLNSKNFKRGRFPGPDETLLTVGKNGLIVVEGGSHKKLRKLVSPAFKLNAIKKTMPIIEMCSRRLVDLLNVKCQQSADGDAVDIEVKPILGKATLDIIGLIAFGYDFGESLSFKTSAFGSSMRELLDVHFSILVMIPYQLPVLKLITKVVRCVPDYFLRLLRYINVINRVLTVNKVHDLVDRLVNEKLIEQRQSEWSELRSKTLLDFLILETADANPQVTHDLLMTFLIAGHETSTLGITWTLYLLAKHPEYQVKCRQETRLFFQKHAVGVDWDDVKQLALINAVVHETLRLYPPVPWIPRVSVNDDIIDGRKVPANTDTFLVPCEAQRHPDFWPNPNEFVPERFLDADSVPWDAYMPFGDGPHKCIGYQLALTEISYLVATIVNNFQFSIDPDVDYREYATITMRIKPDLKLFVRSLHKNAYGN